MFPCVRDSINNTNVLRHRQGKVEFNSLFFFSENMGGQSLWLVQLRQLCYCLHLTDKTENNKNNNNNNKKQHEGYFYDAFVHSIIVYTRLEFALSLMASFFVCECKLYLCFLYFVIIDDMTHHCVN